MGSGSAPNALCLSFPICHMGMRSSHCELIQVQCLAGARRVLGAAVLKGASGDGAREGLRGPCLVPTGRWPPAPWAGCPLLGSLLSLEGTNQAASVPASPWPSSGPGGGDMSPRSLPSLT